MENADLDPQMAPKSVNGFPWNVEYITMSGGGEYIHTCKCRWYVTIWMVWLNTWRVFIFWDFFYLFMGWRRAKTHGPIFMIYTSLCRVSHTQRVVWMIHAALLWVKFLQKHFGGVNKCFRPNVCTIFKLHIIWTDAAIPPNLAEWLIPQDTLHEWSENASNRSEMADSRHFENH